MIPRAKIGAGGMSAPAWALMHLDRWGRLTTASAKRAGIRRHTLDALERAGTLERTSHGAGTPQPYEVWKRPSAPLERPSDAEGAQGDDR